MADLPHPWGAYARLQSKLLHSRHIDDRSWGTEAALNRILISPDSKPLTVDEIARTAASERRRERRRARLRLVYVAADDASHHPEDAPAARHELFIARSKVTKRGWTLLCQVAAGYDYVELAAARGKTPGCLRVRVLRLRRRLAA